MIQLQKRSKWIKRDNNLRIGDLVAISEDGLPPLKWALGRVIETHPGRDGLIRVVTVKTATGIYKRPVVKLSLILPEED